MKRFLLNKWTGRLLCLLVIVGFGYGYYVERAERIKMEIIQQDLILRHEFEMGESFILIDELTDRQRILLESLNNAGVEMFHMRRSIFEMYNELRKYDKSLPPWGGEVPPDPRDRDKWIDDDTKI